MANKVELLVQLENKVKQSQQDLKKLQSHGVFDSKNGEKILTKLNGLIERLASVDLKKLSGPELTKFLNDFSKLRSMLDTAARSLTVYTDAFKKQQEEVNKATKILDQKKTLRSESLQAKKDALNQVRIDGKHTYFNKNTGKQVTNIDTIADLLRQNLLEIRGAKGTKEVSPESYQRTIEKTGLKKYAEATQAYEVAKQEVEAQQVVVNAEKAKLDATPQGGSVHPVTTEVQTESASSMEVVSAVREAGDEETNKQIKETTDNINKQIPTIEKQTSALGKAFKQFTLYNIALKAVKTALREAVQTVKELDKYLTEQAMVTGLTREQTYGLVKSYQNLALQCGATTKEIAEVSTEYMKQGKTIQESLVLTEAAVKAAKVARVSVGDSVNYLTTALNGFRLEAEDAMAVSDKFAAIAAASATDYDELAIALSKVASQANLAGMSIDYTTALLTKGLETTREAPETMGTALKTIIARMRELSDYGETLEDGTDINNVESQLKYVGIALRDQQGELRSTEDVLDKLGHKWDTLNKNQQAAIAKALAGTRQQSRLIAMMEDYERVTELQEISQRSAGATAAQAATYLEGMEAAMNKIQVAWEKIVMTITDSEFIIGIFDGIGNILDAIGAALETTAGSFAIYSGIAALGVGILLNKIAQWETQKSINRGILEEQKAKIKTQKLEKEQLLAGKKRALQILQQAKSQANINKFLARAAQLDSDKSNDVAAAQELSRLAGEQLSLDQQEAALKAEIKITEAEIGQLSLQEAQTSMQIAQNATGFASVLGNALSVLTPIMSIMSLILMIQQATNNATLKGILLKKQENKTETEGLVPKASGMFAKVVQAFSDGSIPGVIAGIALATVLAAALGVTIAASLGAFSGDTKADKTADKVNELSNQIYKLNEQSVAIDKITNSFDNLDNKLIKTKKDLEEMNNLMEQAAEKLSDEGDFQDGKTEKEWFLSQDEEAQRLYLDRKQAQNKLDLQKKRNEQKNTIKKLNSTERKKLFDESSTDADIIAAQGAIYALNNAELYNHIDLLKENKTLNDEEAAAIESVTQAMLENINVSEAWELVKNPDKVKKLAEQFAELKLQVKDTTGAIVTLTAAEVLDSEDYSLKERVEAYEMMRTELESMGSAYSEVLDGFKEEYSGMEVFANMEDSVLSFIETVGLSTDEINELYNAWEKLQKAEVDISEQEFKDRFEPYMEALADTQGDILAATQMVFGDFLDGSEKNLNAFIAAYGDLVQQGVLNIGQQMDKIKNTVNGFYEKSIEWNKMSESDRAEFLQDNADLFKDDLSTEGINEGEQLLRAFESGNYEDIEEALSKNMKDRIEEQRRIIDQELLIEEARVGDARDEVYIAELKRHKKYLEDEANLFKASIEVRLEQQQKQLDEYKSYLEEERDALEDSLEKRKEAYEKYFDKINQEEEDDEYEDKTDLLVSNLSKLGSSTNASAVKQTKELENQLRELEEERLKELRERAQEAVLQTIDDDVKEISEKFDKLLESNQALLAAMQGELNNPVEYIGELLANKIEGGATALEMEDYIGTLQSTYGSVLGDNVDWDAIKVREENNQLFLNVNGQEIALDRGNEQNLYAAIMKALREVGVR